ncbi:MAG: dihydropteroate synthase [Desulfobacteraceae bacterium]|jgi:5-methyltetrahydrofolate corrinoid/iron sulfur protein methyltransferase|nr:dihydropteroate synthase [Desulfobacteraceae bacterium]
MIVVADNLRITLPEIGRALERRDPGPIRQMVSACLEAGAQAIDINSGPLSRSPEDKMTFLVRTVRDTVDLPIVLDTANPRAIAAGLASGGRKATINGVSLESERLKQILPMARQYDCDIIGYLLGPDGHVPADAAGRMEAAVALFSAMQAAGISPERIIIDPVVAPLAWQDGNRQNMAVLEVIRTLPDLLGFPVRTIAGLSNLTTGAPDADSRRCYQGAFLPMLVSAGVSMVLLNVLDRVIMRLAGSSQRIANGSVFSWL